MSDILAQKILYVVGLFLLLIFLVAFFKRVGLLKEEYTKPANFAVINITLPALIFIVIYKSELQIKLFAISAVAFLVFFLVLFLSAIISSRLNTNKIMFGSLILAAAFGNTAYFGYPVVITVFGQDKLVNAVFYDYSIGILLYTAGIYISHIYGTTDKNISIPSAILGVLKFPAFIILIPAILLKNIELPATILSFIEIIGRSTIPLVLLTIGLSLKIYALKENKILIGVIVMLKLIISPLLAVLIAKFLRFSPDMLAVTVVQAGMPTAMMTVVLSSKYGLQTSFLANAVLVTTILSTLTLPLLVLFIL